jgi:LPXTG-motif cell wall-anchored protein
MAQAGQDEETPTTPEGEEQPGGEQNGEQTPTEQNGGTDGEETAGGGGGGTGGETAGGFLPQTGFELAALSAIGLGLLLAGGALWPTSSWPAPRGRLSRSAPRR